MSIFKNLMIAFLGDSSTDEIEPFKGERLSLEHAEYIKNLIARAKEVDEDLRIFGSNMHGYKLNKVIDIKKIREFEERYKFKLPEEYVFFLTKVGNGGAGPHYGLYDFEEFIKQQIYLEYIPNDALINNNLTKEMWYDMLESEDEEDDDEKYEEFLSHLHGGFTSIGGQGCTYSTLLMTNGSEKGKIVYFDWNLEPNSCPYLTHMTFLDWYESYFKELIYGYDIYGYGQYIVGTEEKLVNQYEGTDIKTKEKILRSFFKCPKLKRETIEFINKRDYKKLDDLRVRLLLKYDENKGIKMFEELINGENFLAAMTGIMSLPKDIKKRYYKEKYYKLALKSLYNEDDIYKIAVMEFLEECSCLSSKDLIDFAMDESKEQKLRQKAIQSIGKAKDKMDCIEEIKKLMRSSEYWIADSALKIVYKESDERLIDTFKWMWDRHYKNTPIRYNLRWFFERNGIHGELNMRLRIEKRDYTILWDGVYHKALSNYPEISDWEVKNVLDFIEYEKKHGRKAIISADDEKIMEELNEKLKNKELYLNVERPKKITECTACKQNGCLTKYLCHTSSLEDGKSILNSGKLLSAVKARNISANELVKESRNAAKDPDDYFEYVMFSWGNCQAGDRLVMERKQKRIPTEKDLSEDFTPGIRYYFKYDELVEHKNAAFDGYHALKIKDEVLLKDYVYAIIVPQIYEEKIKAIVPEELKDKVYYLKNDCKDIWDWSEKVYNFVENL